MALLVNKESYSMLNLYDHSTLEEYTSLVVSHVFQLQGTYA